ncbi:MAG: cytochrome c biogenesis protein CcsA [Nitrospirae bacterium]|nr:cytochrome c biogenesis protein CcsA [Nitrospirota bacterium]
MSVLFFELAMTAYLVVAVLFMVYLAGRSETLTRACQVGTVVGFLFHSLALGQQWIAGGGFPVTNQFEAASFFSWTLVLVFLVIDVRYKSHVLGAFVVPLAFLSVLSAAFLRGNVQTIDPGLRGLGLTLHTSLILLGATAFCLSFAAGIMYLIQMRLLKSKHFNALYHHLPPLNACDWLIGRGVLVGFPLTTLGILSGAVGAKFVWGSYWDFSPKQNLSALIWAYYLVMLVGRYTLGIRAKRAAYMAVLGFVAVALSFVGLDALMGETRHF